jgi:hypothetical protein
LQRAIHLSRVEELHRRGGWNREVVHMSMEGVVLVEIGPEGGRRHNSPLMILPSSEGATAEGPLGDET